MFSCRTTDAACCIFIVHYILLSVVRSVWWHAHLNMPMSWERGRNAGIRFHAKSSACHQRWLKMKFTYHTGTRWPCFSTATCRMFLTGDWVTEQCVFKSKSGPLDLRKMGGIETVSKYAAIFTAAIKLEEQEGRQLWVIRASLKLLMD